MTQISKIKNVCFFSFLNSSHPLSSFSTKRKGSEGHLSIQFSVEMRN